MLGFRIQTCDMPTTLRFRVPNGLQDYFSILATGLHLIQLTGRLPEPPETTRVRVRVTLGEEELNRVDRIARNHGISRNGAVVAALLWATRANVLPTRAASDATSAVSPETSSAQRRAGSVRS